jgi:hypothetical protein
MLIGLLNTDPETRINIEQIRNHPWTQKNTPDHKAKAGLIVGYS